MADLNYGKKWGPDIFCPAVELASSVVFKYKSGKFMNRDGSSQYVITATGALPDGWAEVGEFTSNSTAGRNTVALNISCEAIFEMPADATFTLTEAKAFMFKGCDIVTGTPTADIQYADIGSSTDACLQIVGYDVDAQTVFVRRLSERPNADVEQV